MIMRKLSLMFAVLSVAAIAGQAHAQEFPTQPITLIVPYSAGGATDAMFRDLANAASKEFTQPLVVANRPGGSGSVAITSMLGRPTDGHTVSVIVPVLQRASYQHQFSFDTVKDIKPVIQIGGLQYGIVTKADSKFKTLAEVIDYAKANPGKVSYMSAGIGSGGHIYMQELAEAAGGIKFNHIPSKGDADAATALAGGHVDLIAVTPGGWSALVQAGRLKLLATLGAERTKQFPDVPTVKEQGYNVVHVTPLGLGVAANTPDDVVEKLHQGFKKAMNDTAFIQSMDKRENAVMYLGPQDYAKAWADSYVEEGKRAKLLTGN